MRALRSLTAWAASSAPCAMVAAALVAALTAQVPGTWLQVPTQPEFRLVTAAGSAGAGLAADPDRGRVVLFSLGATWEWNGAHWLRMRPTTSPTSPGPLAYDSLRRRVILLAHDPARALEHWEWDGLDWSRQYPAHLPSARDGFAMAFDQARGRLVLFGGENGPSVCDQGDTWEWDGTDWQQVASTGPRSRTYHAMAYDAARQRVVLFGGLWGCSLANGLNDTWEWDGITWIRRTPAVSPHALFGHAMAWDPGRRRLVLYGDWYDNSLGVWHYGETWEWDGIAWMQRNPGPSPGPRRGHVMAHDPVLGEVLLFGGRDNAPNLERRQTWSWNGVTWTRRGDGTPGYAVLAWDSSRSRILGCSFGANPQGTAPLELYEWDGASFALLPVANPPPGRQGFSFAYDRARQRAVLFGGFDSIFSYDFADTWEWTGLAWSQRLPTTSPPARKGAALVCDEGRQRLVLFGGVAGQFPSYTYLADTWTWDGNNWSQQSAPVAPSPRSGHAMAFDVPTQQVVLFGGGDGAITFADTWLWDGSGWSQAQPAVSPQARSGAAMAFDRLRGRMVLFSGFGSPRVADTWEWDGVNWTQTFPVGGPSWRSGASLAFDERHQHLLMWGGYDGRLRAEPWRHGVLQPAGVQSLGSGCVGSGGAPELVSTVPMLGSPDQALDLHRVPPGAPCLVAFSFGTQNVPLGGGCTLYLQNPIEPVFALTNAVGFLSLPFSVPDNPALRGLSMYVQAVALDPQGPASGLVFSNALGLVVGD